MLNILAPVPPQTVTDAQSQQMARLSGICRSAIVGGFTSAALGAPQTYPSTQTDQSNILGSVTASLIPGLAADWETPFWCADGAGVWGMVNHNAAQIQQVGSDGKAWIVLCQQKLATLSAQVMAADSIEAVQAVTW